MSFFNSPTKYRKKRKEKSASKLLLSAQKPESVRVFSTSCGLPTPLSLCNKKTRTPKKTKTQGNRQNRHTKSKTIETRNSKTYPIHPLSLMLGFYRNSNRRDFFMGMELLGRQGTRNKEKKTFSSFHKYFLKWVFCICLSLYFYTSYRITTTTTSPFTIAKLIPPSKTATTHFASRAVIENLITPTIISRTNGQDKLTGRDLKVYVYDLPSKYNEDWLSNPRCSSHLFAAEVAVHRAVMGSEFRTTDPLQTDFFFVPVYVSCNFSAVNGFPSMAHARSLLSSAVDLIAAELPFWNRSGGSDHVFVASHDYGACFHAVVSL